MATKIITLSGKACYCKPWPDQLDTAFLMKDNGEPDPRGGNWATKIALDEESQKTFAALNTKSKVKDGFLKIRRYERHPVLGELGPVKVTGVEEGTAIGNDSDITVTVSVYDYGDRFGKRAMRWEGVHVDNLVEYVKVEVAKPAVGVPAH